MRPRFAIEYHRSLRGKGQVKSILDDIPDWAGQEKRPLCATSRYRGGEKRGRGKELEQTPQMNQQAPAVYRRFFHGEKERAGPVARPFYRPDKARHPPGTDEWELPNYGNNDKRKT